MKCWGKLKGGQVIRRFEKGGQDNDPIASHCLIIAHVYFLFICNFIYIYINPENMHIRYIDALLFFQFSK